MPGIGFERCEKGMEKGRAVRLISGFGLAEVIHLIPSIKGKCENLQGIVKLPVVQKSVENKWFFVQNTKSGEAGRTAKKNDGSA